MFVARKKNIWNNFKKWTEVPHTFLFVNFQSKAQNILSPVLCVFCRFCWLLLKGGGGILSNHPRRFGSACSSSHLRFELKPCSVDHNGESRNLPSQGSVISSASPLPFKITQGNHLEKCMWEFLNAGSWRSFPLSFWRSYEEDNSGWTRAFSAVPYLGLKGILVRRGELGL